MLHVICIYTTSFLFDFFLRRAKDSRHELTNVSLKKVIRTAAPAQQEELLEAVRDVPSVARLAAAPRDTETLTHAVVAIKE